MTTPAADLTPPAHLAGLQLVADPTVVIDRDGQIVYANRLAARLLAVPQQALIGTAADAVLALRTAEGEDWWTCAKPLETDTSVSTRTAEQELTLSVARTNRPVSLIGARLTSGPDAGGMVLTLRRAEARRRRDAARSDLVSTVSHELRSPLTSVKGFTKTLLAKWDRFTDEQKLQMLATVNEDADRVTRLLGELLAVSRIDAGRLQLKRQMVRMDHLLPAVVERLEAGVGSGRDFVVDAAEVPELYADPDRLEQVLTNLMENAVKYTTGTIRVACHDTGQTVTVAIADQGPGIEDKYRSAIFSKFFRRPGERKNGTGLGLYITKGLVEAHGGRIWVTSTPDEGSTFQFTVPKGGLELAGIDVEALRRTTTPG